MSRSVSCSVVCCCCCCRGITVYLCALLLVYVSTTAHHSFFRYADTANIFRNIDHSATFLLIAGEWMEHSWSRGLGACEQWVSGTPWLHVVLVHACLPCRCCMLSWIYVRGNRASLCVVTVPHCAWFVAGTYTPFLLVNLRNKFAGRVVLVFVWALALAGIFTSTFLAARFKQYRTYFYGVIGCVGQCCVCVTGGREHVHPPPIPLNAPCLVPPGWPLFAWSLFWSGNWELVPM